MQSSLSKRWILAYLGFFCTWFMYGARMNISMSIPCMVKHKILNITIENRSRENATHGNNCVLTNEDALESSKHFEFTWNKREESMVLGATYYGYMLTLIPSGILTDRFGGKRVVTIGMTVIALLTLLTPVVARLSFEALVVVRVVLGAASGPILPGIFSLWGKWAPRTEATKLQTCSVIGIPIGTSITFFISGFICNSRIDNGWPVIFYFTGACVLVWLVPWILLTANSPSEHPKITDKERKYIEDNNNEGKMQQAKLDCKTLQAMLTSKAFWAPITAHVCSNWIFHTYTTMLPLYMQEVLKFDITKNGVFSSLPHVCQCVFALIASYAADKIRISGKLSTKVTRKIFQFSGSIGMGLGLVAVGFISCENREYIVVLLSLALGCFGIQLSGFLANYVDFAPRYAGMLFGISNTLASIPGVLSPLIVGLITQNDTQEEWRTVFFVLCGISFFGGLVFVMFAEGEVQNWAKSEYQKDVSSSSVIVTESGLQANVDWYNDDPCCNSKNEFETELENNCHM